MFTTILPDNAMDLFECSAELARDGGPYFWPDGALASEPWAYDFHVYWDRRWNADGCRGGTEAVARMLLRRLLDEQVKCESVDGGAE